MPIVSMIFKEYFDALGNSSIPDDQLEEFEELFNSKKDDIVQQQAQQDTKEPDSDGDGIDDDTERRSRYRSQQCRYRWR